MDTKQDCKEKGGHWDEVKQVCEFRSSSGQKQIEGSVGHSGRSGKDEGIAAVLSFLWPGAGQIYNGQISKAILLWILLLISGFLIFAGIGIVLLPILYIWQIYDAHRTAKDINRSL